MPAQLEAKNVTKNPSKIMIQYNTIHSNYYLYTIYIYLLYIYFVRFKINRYPCSCDETYPPPPMTGWENE